MLIAYINDHEKLSIVFFTSNIVSLASHLHLAHTHTLHPTDGANAKCADATRQKRVE